MKPRQRREDDVVRVRMPQNEFYETLSYRFGIAQVILYMGLLAFVVLSFLTNTGLLTYRNLYLFVKDLNHSMEGVDVIHSDALVYPSSEEQSFTLYRNGLAVAGESAVTVFSATGRQTLSEAISYRCPTVVGNGKYLLVYDLGGTSYSVYNSHTRLYAGTTDYAISFATVSEDGTYLLISSSAHATSIAELYNDRFALVNRFTPKNGYYMCGAIGEKGDVVALVSSAASVTSFSTQLTVCKTGASEASVSSTVADAIALDCAVMPTGEIAVLCSDRVLFFRRNGELLNRHDFTRESLVAYDLGKDGAVLCLRSDQAEAKTRLGVFDKQGRVRHDAEYAEAGLALCRSEDVVFLQTARDVLRIDIKRRTVDRVAASLEDAKMLAVRDDEVLLCSKKKATYLHFR